jgi:YesN/AraC family two-component response regulator
VVDHLGNTLHVSSPRPEMTAICELAGEPPPCNRNGPEPGEAEGRSQFCANAHLYGFSQAERFGGSYVYFCPLGLTHWASPVIGDGAALGGLIGGPVHMVEPDELLIEDLATRAGIQPDCWTEMRKQMDKVPVLTTERTHAMSELLFMVCQSLSDPSFAALAVKKNTGDLQAQLWEQIRFIKSYAQMVESELAYPIAKESLLLEKIEMGDKPASQRILNEILGHVFFSSGGSLDVMKARVVELVVLLSRAAIRGGADVEQIFGLNFMYLNKISSFRNLDEIAYWLSGIMSRFTDQVFNLAHIKHADVIFRAINFIKKNYMKRITLEEAAARVFLSPAYFSRIFKEETGKPFNSFVNQTRIEAAKKLLLNEKISLAEISNLIGFEGQSYFTKVFKHLTGVSPGKFRSSRGKRNNGGD